MTSRKLIETSGAWLPTPEQSLVADLLAQGYSQQAAARLSGVRQPQISHWINRDAGAEHFCALVKERAELFRENLEAVEDQQLVLSTATFHKALQGLIERDDDGNLPVEYLAAVELLRNTRWKQKAGGHQKFGTA